MIWQVTIFCAVSQLYLYLVPTKISIICSLYFINWKEMHLSLSQVYTALQHTLKTSESRSFSQSQISPDLITLIMISKGLRIESNNFSTLSFVSNNVYKIYLLHFIIISQFLNYGALHHLAYTGVYFCILKFVCLHW